MAAFEATGEADCLRMARRIPELIGRHAAENEWRIPEHFVADWRMDRTYAGHMSPLSNDAWNGRGYLIPALPTTGSVIGGRRNAMKSE